MTTSINDWQPDAATTTTTVADALAQHVRRTDEALLTT